MIPQYLFDAAKAIVEAERVLYPGCESAQAVGGSSQRTNFRRAGNTVAAKSHSMGGDLTGKVNAGYPDPAASGILRPLQVGRWANVLSSGPASLPGWGTLNEQQGEVKPMEFAGQAPLFQLAQTDPTSGEFEGVTREAYEQRARDAMSQVATGPDAVRGGATRTGIAQGVMADRLAQGRGQEVRQARLQDAGMQNQASQLYNIIEMARRGFKLQTQQQQGAQAAALRHDQIATGKEVDTHNMSNMALLRQAAELLGVGVNHATEDLSGEGFQNGFQWNILSGCCFIFLQSQNGLLPWFIDEARKDYYTPTRKAGYKWMSAILVPWMQESKLVVGLVNALLVRPFLRYGAWLYKDKSYRCGWLWAPYCKAWLAVWDWLGRKVQKFERS